ncbi:MAG: hypothetical protein DMD62_14900 [Gemmatimonadetes bacterium]|nr:MAG: hypothetical protein DMD62_14900 [Gemmatimonadota bacterium]
MRKLFSGMVLAALALSAATGAQAQQHHTGASMAGAKHELGVDLGLAYVKPNNVSGGISLQTPVDVRFGFVPRSGKKLMWEPRLTLNFNTVGGNTTYLFTPQVNALYANTPGMHRKGMYFTGGAGLVMGDGGAGSGTALKLEAGIGWRKPYESAAWRYEVGVQYVSASDNLGLFADYIAIGGRIGISLWH